MRIKLIVQAMKMLTVPVLLAGLTLGPAATAMADTAPGGTGATTPTADKTPTPKPKMDVVAADKPTPTPKPKMNVN
jgi:hypothetical protein